MTALKKKETFLGILPQYMYTTVCVMATQIVNVMSHIVYITLPNRKWF